MAKEGKKVVDLIYIEKQKSESTVIKEYNFSLDHWKNTLKRLQEHYFEQHFNSTSPDVLEILAMRKFIGAFVQSRVNWIVSEVKDQSLRRKYLNVIPPFQLKGGMKTILLHFFQMEESEDKKSILYKAKNDIEKEICILWDIYKLRKTIDSIETIKKSLNSDNAFESVFSVAHRKECLESLKTVFQLMFQMTIQKDHQRTLYSDLSPELMQPENVLERQEQDRSYVYPHVIRKYDYRNHFFYVYYSPGMKAKIAGDVKKFHYNYLDFEVIKQEFLINWLNTRLGGNENKRQIYKNYAIGDRRVDQIIDENPEKEIEILKQLPLAVFNDITAQVNDAVNEELKTKVDPQSENHGEFSKVAKEFGKAQSVAKSGIKKLKSILKSKKDEREEIANEPEEAPPPPKPKEIIPEFAVFKVQKNQIDYPYFQKESSVYKAKMSLLRVKMGPKYTSFNKGLGEFFSKISDSALIRRRTPKHEVIFPHVIKETKGEKVINHLLILGAEVKAKQLSMAYSTGGESTHSFTCFFLYGSDVDMPEMGETTDSRNARGIQFQIYDFANPAVQEKALRCYELVMAKK